MSPHCGANPRYLDQTQKIIILLIYLIFNWQLISFWNCLNCLAITRKTIHKQEQRDKNEPFRYRVAAAGRPPAFGDILGASQLLP
ncbi:MAG: hypothetical protein ACRC04_13475, partial [Aeromonas veronii]